MTLVLIGILPDFQRVADVDGNPINNLGLRLKDYNDAMKLFCEKWGIPFVDVWNCGIFTKQNSYSAAYDSTKRYLDNLHSSIFAKRLLVSGFIVNAINAL